MQDNEDVPGSYEPEVFLAGKYVNLTILTNADVLNSGWHSWFNDQETTRLTQHGRFPNTRDDQLEFFRKDVKANKSKLQLGICDVSGGPIVGVISLQNIDYINRNAELAVMVGVEQYRHVKYFVEACTLIIEHGFKSLNLNRIYGGSLSSELVELMCRTLGMSREGVLAQDVYKNGKYVDVHLYGQLKINWQRGTD